MSCQNVGEDMDCSDLKRIVAFREAVDEKNQILISERLQSTLVSTSDNICRLFHILCPEDSKGPSKEALVL